MPRATRLSSACSRMPGASSTDSTLIQVRVSAASSRAASFSRTRSSMGLPVGVGSLTTSASGPCRSDRRTPDPFNAAPARAHDRLAFEIGTKEPSSSSSSRSRISSVKVSMAGPATLFFESRVDQWRRRAALSTAAPQIGGQRPLVRGDGQDAPRRDDERGLSVGKLGAERPARHPEDFLRRNRVERQVHVLSAPGSRGCSPRLSSPATP